MDSFPLYVSHNDSLNSYQSILEKTVPNVPFLNFLAFVI